MRVVKTHNVQLPCCRVTLGPQVSLGRDQIAMMGGIRPLVVGGNDFQHLLDRSASLPDQKAATLVGIRLFPMGPDQVQVERIHTPRKQGEVHFQIAAAGRTARAVLTVKHLSHAYEDEQIVLLDANLEIERGDKVVLVGPNGSGKSTLLRALAGTVEPTEGTIAWGERAEVGYYDQHQDEALDGSRTVIDEVRSVAEWSSEQELRDALGRFLFRGDDVFKKVSVLSGGERSRVALAKFLIQPSNVLLLDEPTNHLDITTRRKLLEALVGYGGTIVCASHDPAILRQVATKAYAITNGQCERLMEWAAWEAADDRPTR